MNQQENQTPSGAIVAIVKTFLTGPMSLMLIIVAILLGIMAIQLTPREEDPQIVVPMVDVMVNFPGHSPKEVEQLVMRPLEKLLWQIDGVEHVYSVSYRDKCMVVVRFFVGQDRDRAMVKIRDKIGANRNIVPPGVRGWMIKPSEIDDVPIVTLTLTSHNKSSYELSRIAEEVEARLASVKNIYRTAIYGDHRREVRIEANLSRLQAYGLCFQDITRAIASNNNFSDCGSILKGKNTLVLFSGKVIDSAKVIKRIPVKSIKGRPVYVEDVATVKDTVVEPTYYHHSCYGPASKMYKSENNRQPAVTISFSKKKGTNAVEVAKDILKATNRLKGKVIPSDVDVIVSRNYGVSANAKVNDLLENMFFAILTVIGLMTFTMGWRAAFIVGLSVPVSFALALFMNLILGFTINRVTLFALILSLGLVVDDPITNVDNIQRHIQMGKQPPMIATLSAVKEVLPPVIMSTLSIIVSFLPMFFITGMMGPYMGPMAINVPLTVTFSMVCALTFVPWVSFKLIKRDPTKTAEENKDGTALWIKKLYRAVEEPFLNRKMAVLLILLVIVLLIGSLSLLVLRKVPLKMLPFDNKNELQLVLDMPEGTSLEETDKATREIEQYLERVNEVKNIQSYVGTPAPIDFNGLVRHYNMRTMPNDADIRVNLAPKAKRKEQSHATAMRIRDPITKIAEKYGAKVSIVEIPPGPPVFSTITVEVYGDEDTSYNKIVKAAKFLEQQFKDEDAKHIQQIDDMNQSEHERYAFIPNVQKAALHGLTSVQIQQMLKQAIDGKILGIAHIENEREPVLIDMKLKLKDRNSIERLKELQMRTQSGKLVPLGELGKFVKQPEEQIIMHKDMKPVVFVTAECIGRAPPEVAWDMNQRLKKHPMPKGTRAYWFGEGEIGITVTVFRDLGIAFGVALIGIYLLLAIQMENFLMPLLVMAAIPLTIIGIAPGFYLLNLLATHNVAGYPNPIFFTATGMIGMIALGGIVIRNSLVLVEFIRDAVKSGKPLKEAILDSGAVRFRPIMLTATTTLLGAWPITLDPIFSGLAWALIFGLIASTFFTLIIVPTIYYLSQSSGSSEPKIEIKEA